ncbi:MAG TPA: cation diffusion facilitator family transporter [bacterium]|nr:cation diffusion facilitator family transporter [bacterium]HPN42866.1 cation diffusion facilitator family transporter [bacterium]
MAHSHQHVHEAPANLRVAFALNLIFTIIEFGGGLLTGSMAILSDALHDLGDTITIGLSLYLEKFSRKQRDQNYSYGYRRFSLAAALISSVVLCAGSMIILYRAIPAVINPTPVHKTGMLGLAVLGILVNGFAVIKLKTGKSRNEQVVRLHLLEDMLGWVAVLIGSLVIMAFDFYVIDPLLSLLIAGYILYRVVKNLREIVQLFLQGIPPAIDIERIINNLSHVEQVESVHDVHVWSLDGNYHVLSAHIVVRDVMSWEEIGELRKELRTILHDLDIEHETLEIETVSQCCEYKTC